MHILSLGVSLPAKYENCAWYTDSISAFLDFTFRFHKGFSDLYSHYYFPPQVKLSLLKALSDMHFHRKLNFFLSIFSEIRSLLSKDIKQLYRDG